MQDHDNKKLADSQSANSDPRQHILELIANGHYAEVIPLLQSVCAGAPGNAEAFYHLGCSHARLQQWQEATHALQHSIQLRPDAAQSYLALAGILITTEKHDEAAEHLTTVLSLNNRMIEAHFALADIRAFQDNYPAAREHLEKALSISPKMSKVHFQLGKLELLFRHHEKAITHLEQALEYDSESVQILCTLASCLANSARHQEAKTAYLKVIDIDPNYLEAQTGLALVYEYIGQHEKAIELIDPLLVQQLFDTSLALTFARTCKLTGRCKEAVNYINDMLKHPGLPKHTRATLHFDVGKILDRMEEYDQAFAHYKAGNDTVVNLYDAVGNVQSINNNIEIFTPELYFRLPKATHQDVRPIFIVGMPRSGTSLTEQILASHPNVRGGGELTTLSALVNKTPAITGSNKPFPSCIGLLTQANIENIARKYLDHLNTISTDAIRITDKMPHNFYLLGIIQVLFPEARVIHCTRDPMDTCLSIYFQNFSDRHEYARDLFNIGIHYHQYKRIMKHWNDVLSIPILELQYEDLVGNQVETTRRLLGFCDLEWSDSCLDFYKLERVLDTSSYDQIRQPIYTHSVGRWKHYEHYLEPLKEGLERGY